MFYLIAMSDLKTRSPKTGELEKVIKIWRFPDYNKKYAVDTWLKSSNKMHKEGDIVILWDQDSGAKAKRLTGPMPDFGTGIDLGPLTW